MWQNKFWHLVNYHTNLIEVHQDVHNFGVKTHQKATIMTLKSLTTQSVESREPNINFSHYKCIPCLISGVLFHCLCCLVHLYKIFKFPKDGNFMSATFSDIICRIPKGWKNSINQLPLISFELFCQLRSLITGHIHQSYHILFLVFIETYYNTWTHASILGTTLNL